jgi:hypothetical protein
VQNREVLDWEGGAGLDEFGAAGKEAGDLVISGWRPAAPDTVCAIVASMSGFSIPGLGGGVSSGGWG